MHRVSLVMIWPAVGLALMLATAHAEETPRKQGPAPYAGRNEQEVHGPQRGHSAVRQTL